MFDGYPPECFMDFDVEAPDLPDEVVDDMNNMGMDVGILEASMVGAAFGMLGAEQNMAPPPEVETVERQGAAPFSSQVAKRFGYEQDGEQLGAAWVSRDKQGVDLTISPEGFGVLVEAVISAQEKIKEMEIQGQRPHKWASILKIKLEPNTKKRSDNSPAFWVKLQKVGNIKPDDNTTSQVSPEQVHKNAVAAATAPSKSEMPEIPNMGIKMAPEATAEGTLQGNVAAPTALTKDDDPLFGGFAL